MTFALQKLKGLLAQAGIPETGIVVTPNGKTVIVATRGGAREATAVGILSTGDRVALAGDGTAIKIDPVTTAVEV